MRFITSTTEGAKHDGFTVLIPHKVLRLLKLEQQVCRADDDLFTMISQVTLYGMSKSEYTFKLNCVAHSHFLLAQE